MLGHERRDEIIAMVVSRLDAQRQRDAGLGACFFEQLGPQFLFDERVRGADIDEDFVDGRAVLDQRDGIVPAPRGAIFAEIAAERLLAPGHLTGRDDRSECGNAAKAVGKLSATVSAP